MNALPELKPIDIAVLQRPMFDNSRLGVPMHWLRDNVEILARYYNDQNAALPPEERATSSDGEFDVWLLVQHDIEVQRWRFLQYIDDDPTPWCNACGAMVKARCHCGAIADNE